MVVLPQPERRLRRHTTDPGVDVNSASVSPHDGGWIIRVRGEIEHLCGSQTDAVAHAFDLLAGNGGGELLILDPRGRHLKRLVVAA